MLHGKLIWGSDDARSTTSGRTMANPGGNTAFSPSLASAPPPCANPGIGDGLGLGPPAAAAWRDRLALKRLEAREKKVLLQRLDEVRLVFQRPQSAAAASRLGGEGGGGRGPGGGAEVVVAELSERMKVLCQPKKKAAGGTGRDGMSWRGITALRRKAEGGVEAEEDGEDPRTRRKRLEQGGGGSFLSSKPAQGPLSAKRKKRPKEGEASTCGFFGDQLDFSSRSCKGAMGWVVDWKRWEAMQEMQEEANANPNRTSAPAVPVGTSNPALAMAGVVDVQQEACIATQREENEEKEAAEKEEELE